MISRYYQEELQYLLEAGKEFAKAHPEQARYLHIGSESKEDRDPYVERLFEGFAFLSGKIRQRLDDELPELTEAFFNLLWPHFLKPIPSMAILEFKPRPGLVQQTTTFPRGTEVRSGPVGEESAVCRFRTTQEVRLQPLKLKEAFLTWPPDGTSNVTLRFVLEKGIEYQKLQLNPLRLFSHAEDTIASNMHLFFIRHVARVVISAGDANLQLNGQKWIQPVGLTTNEGLLPYSPYSFSGYRLLQEYLSFRRKFWFADLHGLEQFTPPPKTSEFQVQIFFDRLYPEEKNFKTDNLRLFCTPIANLFRSDAEPIRVDHLSSEYRLTPDARHLRSVEVYSIDSVESVEEGTGERHGYSPFFSFRQSTEKNGRYFTSTTRIGPSERFETYLSPGGLKIANDSPVIPVETLSLELTCTNGTLPREKLQERSITQPAPDFPNIATFENITQPTLALYPPIFDATRSPWQEKNFLWKLISHLAFNYRSAATLESLRGLLELYDWTGTDANKLRIEGLRSVSWTSKEIIQRGAVLRGVEVTIEVQEKNFADEGDRCLFGLVMSEFFSLYASINSFVHLTLVEKPGEKRYQWQTPQNRGKQPLV